MKKSFFALTAFLFLIMAFAFKAIHSYADIFKQLQIEQVDAKESIFDNFQDGVLYFPYSEVVRQLAVGRREAAVNEIGNFIKSYTESAEFIAKYKAARDDARPEKNADGEDVKNWQQNYPPTVKDLVKKRLTEFLELTRDIDFDAKLVRSGSKMVFANPQLEAKSNEWKRCFRCGKETVMAARKYAQQWLASLK